MKLRFIIALWVAKISIPALKITGHNGTDYPGVLALKICPTFLKYIAKPRRVITVTGTNGKTTVSNLIIDALESTGKKVLNNRAGSNISSGISTSLLKGVSIFNRSKYDLAVLEVDERSSKRIYPYVKPEITVITNLFRDSIMRNAHPDYIAGILTDAIPESTRLILNADDLISARVAPKNKRVYFGIERLDSDITECINLINDVRVCPECGGELKYDYLRYHHIGKAFCKDCGYKSPEYDYAAGNVDINSMTMTAKDAGGSMDYKLISDSTFNIYNMITVIAFLREFGLSHEEVKACFEKIHIVESRYNQTKAGNVNVVVQMAKDRNALACSRAMDYVVKQPGKKEIFLMMNNFSDERKWSENTCWMYDCDFEFLADENITHIVTTGPRGKDYRLRLLIAGVPDSKIEFVSDELEATEHLYLEPDTSVYIFYGTDALALMGKVQEKTISLAKAKAGEVAEV